MEPCPECGDELEVLKDVTNTVNGYRKVDVLCLSRPCGYQMNMGAFAADSYWDFVMAPPPKESGAR